MSDNDKKKTKEYLAPCPCLEKDMGNYNCLNLDSIRDVVFVDMMGKPTNIKSSPDNPLCVNFLYVGEDDRLYCATTDQPITIRKYHVKSAQFKRALDKILVWLPKNQPKTSSDICAPCLYRSISTEIENLKEK